MDKTNPQADHVENSRGNDERSVKSHTLSRAVGLLVLLIGVIGVSVWRFLTGNKKTHQGDPSDESVRRGHEQSDANIRAIVLSGIGLFVTIGIIHILLLWKFGYFAAHRIEPSMPPSALASIERLPPEPRLQVSPQEDLKKMREAEDRILNRYGWVDEKAGIVRIPIGYAMELIVKRGLPVRSAKNDER